MSFEWRRPVAALHVLIVGLALHNLVMSELWRAGVRGGPLTVVSAWWDALLVLALVLVIAAQRRLPFDGSAADRLALVFAAFVVVYGLLPQSWLGGGATHKGVLYAARHDLLPVGAYFLGRGLALTEAERARLCRTVLGTAAFVALFGLIDVYAVPLSYWRGSAGWFRDQLGLNYGAGVSYLPQNFVYNAGNDVVFRRLTSTFLSPLASAYLLVVALFFLSLRTRVGLALGVLLFAAILWTHTRAALIALIAALLLLALVRRAWRPALFAALVLGISVAFVAGYTHFGPRTHFTPAEQKQQEKTAQQQPQQSNDATSANESSIHEHIVSLWDGTKSVVEHPWGYGLGNAGVTAERTNVKVVAGESTYTELGVETSLAGALVFIAWCVALLVRTLRRRRWLGAAFFAILVIGLQTDVIGVPWIAVTVWALVA
ncbi:MAG TPA: O-antigen ligase family protein [Gaiellaceae bacterium]|nr:O-antigen ligase family protein [Gaiellaceae bacterium]